jgi:hypothetical protein
MSSKHLTTSSPGLRMGRITQYLPNLIVEALLDYERCVAGASGTTYGHAAFRARSVATLG